MLTKTLIARPKRVLLVELNEVNWTVVDRLIEQRGSAFLPYFGLLRREGVCATQVAVERPPKLDPWITWVTLHTGVSPGEHGASVLEQDATAIRAKRLWDYVADAGRSVGVFGSISAYPPRRVNGFMVPGPFAPSDETYPVSLRAIQSINRLGTQVHNQTARTLGPVEAARTLLQLIRLGLRPRTVVRIASQLVAERIRPQQRWRRVCLQPLMNFDFFSSLFRRHKPDFATWHTNHAAHFMHHYWRAWDDKDFSVPSTADERENYGEAVPEGYRLCDELIGRFLRLLEEDTVLIVASSMGQQPFESEQYSAGKVIVRFKSIERIIELLGRRGIEAAIPTMVPQWNLRIPDRARRTEIKALVQASYRVAHGCTEPAMAIEETEGVLTITPLGFARYPTGARYFFPGADGGSGTEHAFEDLFVADSPTVKQGMHHPNGMLCFYGSGIRRGHSMASCSNLDVAPTVLHLLGIPVPDSMTGKVLVEAWSGGDGIAGAQSGLDLQAVA